MGRRPKPLAELELSGALKARPGRYKQRLEAAKAAAQAPVAQNANDSDKPSPLGSAPKWLGPAEKAIWKELSKTYPNLTFSDRFHLEIAVTLTHKLRTAEGGLKGQEYSQLLGILDRFAPIGSIKSDIGFPAEDRFIKTDKTVSSDPAPLEDTRTETEKAWDDFVAEDEEDERREKLVRAEMEISGRDYRVVRDELFPEEAEAYKKMLADNSAFIDRMRAEGKWTDSKPKVEEKIEYTPVDRPPTEPFIEDPAKRLERMRLRWSM